LAALKKGTLRFRLHEIVFEADTKAGKAFDVVLLVLIVLSVLAVMLESIESLDKKYHNLFYNLEWILTVIFTIEYVLRIAIVAKPQKYIFSFFGIIDLLAIIPTYLGLFVTGSHYLTVVRILRLLRIFRIFKLGRYLKESRTILVALRKSRLKITVFIFAVVMLSCIIGSIMYIIEGPEYGFTSIPQSMYWAIVTLTTVGYGDIAPHTPLGQFFSSIVMILGYGIIAVPTGMVSSELNKISAESLNTQSCTSCSREGHDDDADYCKYCGTEL